MYIWIINTLVIVTWYNRGGETCPSTVLWLYFYFLELSSGIKNNIIYLRCIICWKTAWYANSNSQKWGICSPPVAIASFVEQMMPFCNIFLAIYIFVVKYKWVVHAFQCNKSVRCGYLYSATPAKIEMMLFLLFELVTKLKSNKQWTTTKLTFTVEIWENKGVQVSVSFATSCAPLSSSGTRNTKLYHLL